MSGSRVWAGKGWGEILGPWRSCWEAYLVTHVSFHSITASVKKGSYKMVSFDICICEIVG
jgi:hypothetical protein